MERNRPAVASPSAKPFIADCFGNLSLSPKGSDSGIVFVGMTRSGWPMLRTILEDSTNEFYTTSSKVESSGLAIS
jgi:hypothetical protein